jgi:hypothetical protein
MSDLYQGDPLQYGGFEDILGQSSSKGYYQKPQNLPFYQGRSILATIPEYQRNPLLLEKDLLVKIVEGRPNLMRMLSEQLLGSGGMSVNDVRFRVPVEQEPLPRLYLDEGEIPVTAGRSTFKITSNKDRISTAMPGGNPKQVGDIARLEVNQYVMIMFSWVEPRRTNNIGGGSYPVYYSNAPVPDAPVPEIGKVVSVDYNKGTCVIERNWAGAQRETNPSTPATVNIVGNDQAYTPGVVNAQIQVKDAFILPMAKEMKEDEIDAKVKNFSNTWRNGVLQRHALAWGSQYMSEVISRNMGLTSPLATSKQQAIKDFYDHWEITALFSEQSESWDPETGYWSGTTDGILANVPKSHYIAIKGIDWHNANGFVAGQTQGLGTFHPMIFNKFLEGKSLIGSQHKVIIAGANFYNSFSTMINFMTQMIPDIKSEWMVFGKRFSTSDGLVVDVLPSDKMTLNGMRNSAVMYDAQYFKNVKLNNYPIVDIVEINNEVPLKTNGIVHGVRGFIDSNPDAHWVFTITEAGTAEYDDVDVLGTPLDEFERSTPLPLKTKATSAAGKGKKTTK